MIYDITAQGSTIDKAYIDFIFADPDDQAHAWVINQAAIKSNNRDYGQTGEKRPTTESIRCENKVTTI